MTFGEYLRQLRQARKMAKNALAGALGVPFSTVNNWELHGAAPKPANMRAIVAKLNLTVAEKTKLTELWLGMSRSGEREVMPPESAPAPTSEPQAVGSKPLETLLTKSLDPARHSMFDAVAVFQAIGEAGALVTPGSLSEAAARTWLDAAAELREKGAKVTAAALLVTVALQRVRHQREKAHAHHESQN